MARARASSRREPRAWTAFTPQLPDALSARLVLRLARDQEATGDFQLGLLHYLNAAYAAIPPLPPPEDWIPPADPEERENWRPPEAVRWALAWRDRGIAHCKMVTSGSKLHEDVARVMHKLPGRLGLLRDPVLTWEVQAEALARLLDQLDAADAG